MRKILAVSALLIALILWQLVFRKSKKSATKTATKPIDTKGIQQVIKDISPSETIFVNLACYRDPECVQTLYSLFSTAANPTRVWVGLLDQSYDHDTNILEEYARLCKKRRTYNYSNQIRRYHLLPSKSRGHIVCRYLVDHFLFRSEKYHLTIDSHTLFVKYWDYHMCEELNKLISPQCPHPVLTMDPPTYHVTSRSAVSDFNQEPGYYMSCSDKPKKGYLLPSIVSESMQHVPDHPIPTCLWSGAMSFSRSASIRRVPFDPHLSYVHTGENVYMAARLFTHGLQCFHPTRSYMASMKGHSYRYTVFDQFTKKQQKERTKAYQRMYLILGLGVKLLSPQQQRERYQDKVLTQDANVYGLGTVRTLDDYFAASGLNWKDMGVCQIGHIASIGVTSKADHVELMAKLGVLFVETENEFTK